MSLDQRYIQHLRRRAKDTDLPSTALVCPLCKKPTALRDSSFFSRHLSESHSSTIDEESKNPDWDFEEWRDGLESRARTLSNTAREQDKNSSQSSLQPQPDLVSAGDSRGSADLSLTQLTLNASRQSSARHGQPAPGQGGPQHRTNKRPSSQGEQDHRIQYSQTRGGKNPRRATRRVDDQQVNPGQVEVPPRTPNASFKPHFASDGTLLTRTLFNPASEASTSQVTGPSHTPQPSVATAPGPEPYPRQHHSVGPQYSSSVQQHGQSSHERGVLPLSNEMLAHQTLRERGVITMPIDPRYPDMLMQPDSRPISQEQLAAEVKSIYAGLTMVESKCIHVDKAQASALRSTAKGENKIADDHWQALIALHRTLLHEHHDFFLASQHPSASPALRRLASKYSMPARMWKHGIHSFLELLRYRLPDSLEFMISFIYTAYQMMSLLYETVPAFEDTWIECLGDLGRYRMAIEDEDIRDREIWAGVARFWYSKAADRSPDVGRLYHHLAILARPNALQQLYLYSRSLISVQPFQSARESILTLFNPIMGLSTASSSHLSELDTYFIKINAVLFSKEQLHQYEPLRDGFLSRLDPHIGRVTAKWREQGAYVAVAILGALYDYGTESPLRRLFEHGFHKLAQGARTNPRAVQLQGFDAHSQRSSPMSESTAETLAPISSLDANSQRAFGNAIDLLVQTATLVLKRIGDKNVLPFVHLLLAFLYSLSTIQSFDYQVQQTYVASSIIKAVPWKELCTFMNTLARAEQNVSRYECEEFIRPEKGDGRPLPEDHLIRGQVWSQDYFPSDWFKDSEVDDEERSIEHASTVRIRAERVLWLMYRISSIGQFIRYDKNTRSWSSILPSELEAAMARPAASSPFPKLEQPEDIVMRDASSTVNEDSELGYISDEDSPEMKLLKKGHRQRFRVGIDDERLNVPSNAPSDTADSMFQSDYTVMVCDEKLLLKNQDVFELLVERQWKIVVPHSAIADLSWRSKANGPDSPAAQQALHNVKKASTNTNVRILTAQGKDTTKQDLWSERSASPSCENPLEPTEDPEETLIGVTRQASGLSSYETPKTGKMEARPSVLLTEDRQTRIRAAQGKVAAISPSTLKNFLLNTRSRIRRLSQTSRTSGQDQATGSGPLPTDSAQPTGYGDRMEQ